MAIEKMSSGKQVRPNTESKDVTVVERMRSQKVGWRVTQVGITAARGEVFKGKSQRRNRWVSN
jgi:hypothetical protein